jgi:hypothetical protein
MILRILISLATVAASGWALVEARSAARVSRQLVEAADRRAAKVGLVADFAASEAVPARQIAQSVRDEMRGANAR